MYLFFIPINILLKIIEHFFFLKKKKCFTPKRKHPKTLQVSLGVKPLS